MPTHLSTFIPTYAAACLAFSVALPCCGEDRQQPLDMLPGIARPIRKAELAFSTEGVLRELHVREGEWIDASQMVASLQDSIASAAVALAEKEANQTAELQLAKVKLNEAQTHFRRIEQMSRQRAAAEAEVDRARYDMLKTEAEYARALESHQLAIARLEYERSRLHAHQVHAPFAGKVISIEKQLGEFVSNDDPIIVLADSTELVIDLFVPWKYEASIREGNQYSLASETLPDRQIEATCVSKERNIDPASRTFRCRFLIDNKSQRLPAGFAARLCLP